MKLSSPIYQLKRRARAIARHEGIPLHRAQDRIARLEGFASWSLLASKASKSFSDRYLDKMGYGDLVLLGARPGHGKTLTGLIMLLEARRAGRRAILFTLDLTQSQARKSLEEMSNPELAAMVEVETSDNIDADFIADKLNDAPQGTLAVVDYLQLLDERRSKPALVDQVRQLHRLAKSNGIILVFLSQIDRGFDPTQGDVPKIADVRLPNPLPMELFSKGMFLHDGKSRIESLI